MELTLVRFDFSDKSTIGKLSIDGVYSCFVLEDTCREPAPGMWEPEMKRPGLTAIPYGRYRVIISLSNRFKKMLPEVLGVPNFEGVRIHTGNKPADTEGCLLPGLTRDRDWVGNSSAAFGPLFREIDLGLHAGQKVWLEVTK